MYQLDIYNSWLGFLCETLWIDGVHEIRPWGQALLLGQWRSPSLNLIHVPHLIQPVIYQQIAHRAIKTYN